MSDKLQKAREATVTKFKNNFGCDRGRIEDLIEDHCTAVDHLLDDGEIENEESEIRKILESLTRSTVVAPRKAARTIASQPNAKRVGKDPRDTSALSLVVSPFRFVELNDTVVESEQQQPDLSRPLAGGYRAQITVEWAAETPLLIGETSGNQNGATQVDGPVTMAGQPVIPGSSIRGCLRAAMEIVASARLNQINAHAIYGLRDFDHPLIKPLDESKSPLAVRNVKAGWLSRTEAGDYTITPCAEWHLIEIAKLPVLDHERASHRDEYDFRAAWLKKSIPERYRSIDRSWVTGGADKQDGIVNFHAMKPQGFDVIRERSDGKAILSPVAKGSITGHLVFSSKSPAAPKGQVIREREERGGPGQPKKYEYVFSVATEPPVKVSPGAWNRFLGINSRIFKNKLKGEGSWGILESSLRKPGDRIPVFFVGDGASLQIGLTRFFKVQHRYSIGTIRDRDPAHKRAKVASPASICTDFVEALFGYVHEPDELFDPVPPSVAPGTLARRSRIGCGFARLTSDHHRTTAPISTVMGAPRASFAPFYLRGIYKDYSSENARLAGRKRYMPRFPTDELSSAESEISKLLQAQITRIEEENGKRLSEALKSRLKFLVPAKGQTELRFTGDLRLDNVSAAELGAVLWVLTHGGDPAKPYRHMMGRGRPFGAGQMRVHRLSIRLFPNDDAARQHITSPEGWETAWGDNGISMAPFLRAFHRHMRAARPNWPETTDMKEFMVACNPQHGKAVLANDRRTYPALKDFNAIRQLSKESTRFAPPANQPSRHLPVPGNGAYKITLPYDDGTPG